QLTGTIPRSIGQLSNLTKFSLWETELTGPIPAELGQLSNLTILDLAGNQLTGPIPPSIGRLSNLTHLHLAGNLLTGPIPRELRRLSRLISLALHRNQLSGPIPPWLGELSELRWLQLSENALTGPIPPELGQLSNLTTLALNDNKLSGSIPGHLERLSDLTHLSLQDNRLTGPVPRGLLVRFSREAFKRNRLSGILPAAPLVFPEDPKENGNASHHSISYHQGPLEWTWDWKDSPVRYQQPIAGRTSVLAVRIGHESAEPPRVVTGVRDADDRVLAERLLETALPSTTSTDEGRWLTEYAFRLPGDLNRPGNRLTHVIDPDDEMPETNEDDNVGEPITLEGQAPPRFRLTFIPMHRSGQPPPVVEPLDLMVGVHSYLPIADDYVVEVADPVETTATGQREVLEEVEAIWNADGDPNEFYYGICPLADCRGGIATLGGRAAASHAGGFIVAHELGHNFNLGHAPCGVPGDPDFPYADAGIGPHGGWRITGLGEFVPPHAGYYDLMTYCGPVFMSDYHFDKATKHWLGAGGTGQPPTARVHAPLGASAKSGSLAVSGSVDAAGVWRLGHAQRSHKPARVPAPRGAFTLIVRGAEGTELHREPLQSRPLSHEDGQLWAARVPVLDGRAGLLLIVDSQGRTVLRERLEALVR
ncbi:MAG: hypothetical protein F4X36_20945, partial [Gammaproteobacteria bacterium]|nr:hypothetical protein [Gammaproteobacteria bacterium]